MRPTFSIIVCTHNRAALLRDCLATLGALDHPKDDHEIVVVDNASTDETAAAVAAVAARLPHVRATREPRPGHTRARNRGIAAAGGAILVFLDDDATVAPDYLDALAAAYRARPDAAGFGGRIVLAWDTGRPPWVLPSEEGYWVALDRGPAIVPFRYPAAPYGANMSFRREWLERVGAFDEELGYSFAHGRLSARDDMELGYRIMAAGGALYYTPAAWITHRITADRATVEYFLHKAYGQGYADYQTFGERAGWGTPHRLGRLALHAAAFARAVVFGAATLPFGRESRTHMLYRVKRRYNAGFMAALLDHLPSRAAPRR